ncbi:hypothetical protein BaRGS_00026632, partial [Batillaria attramentaria]
MVFESFVTDMINRYLGDFVENLDTSQLKIGIWGGDVVLNKLHLKESALDDLDLPVKVKAGHIEREEAAKQAAKQQKLAQIEEAKKLEAQKGKPVEEKVDTFSEKLATQVIKNLQVKVSNIHVRYEDRFTNPKRPFSVGFTMQELLFQTTDENWTTTLLHDAVSQIYKESLKINIRASQGLKTDYQYVVRPISAVAHVRLNTKPEQTNFTIPKLAITVVFNQIAVGLTKDQYDDLLEMMESVERMNLLSLYRKYRPDMPLSGHSRTWWRYAYNSVLEETVRRRRRMWSWQHIWHHRRTMKRYRKAYLEKLDTAQVPSDIQKTIEVLTECEQYLDVFCITIMRQQAEVEAAKLGAKRKESLSSGWFGGWFGGGSKKEEESRKSLATEEIQEKFYELYTPDEKTKLYSAIGYQENETDLTLPVELQLRDVYSLLEQRPAANAIEVHAKVDKMVVSGMPHKNCIPKIIRSQTPEREQVYSLFNISLETNPLDGHCDTRVKVRARPLEIIYDAKTINKLSDFFTPPESVQLKQFSQAAMSQFEEIREMSAAGMQHAIEQHKYTDISVNLASSCIIVPHGGVMKNNVRLLVLDLGHLSVESEKHKVDIRSESLETKMEKAYDKFNIKLQRIQLLFVHPGEKWQAAREAGHSSMHILAPISILLDLWQCIFDKEPRMARMKVSGVLPNISVSISDLRLKEILDLVQSIPLPEPPEEDEEVEDLLKTQEGKKTELRRVKSQDLNFIDMTLQFEIREVVLAVSQTDKVRKRETPLLKVLVERIGTDVKMRTFDMFANAYLGAIYVQHLKYKLSGSPVINLLNSPTVTDASKHLLTVTYHQANKKGPEFASKYASTEQSIEVTFSALELLLHQGAILSLMEFVQGIESHTLEPMPETSHITIKSRSSDQRDHKPLLKRQVKEDDLSTIEMKVGAMLGEFSVGICNEDKLITDIHVKGIEVNVAMMKQKMKIGALLRDMTIFDPDPRTKYHKIIQTEGSELLKVDVVMYNGATEGEKYADMKCVDTSVSTEIGCIKIVFLTKCINDLLDFVAKFQTPKNQKASGCQGAAQSGVGTVHPLQETAARVGLHVQVKAPVIVLPQNWISLNTLILDLGQMSVTSAFRLAGKVSSNKIPAVLQDIKIVLTSLRLSRVYLHEDGCSVEWRCTLLEPVTSTLNMQVNLSTHWYKDSPPMELTGMLQPLVLRLSQSDFRTINQVMEENLYEGYIYPTFDCPDSSTFSINSRGSGTKRHSRDSHKPTLLHMELKIEGLAILMYSGDSVTLLDLKVVTVGAGILTDISILAKVLLQDIILDDLRPSKQAGITRMIERSMGMGAEAKSCDMIVVDYWCDPQWNQTVRLGVNSLYLCVCVDFLLQLGDFFANSMPQYFVDMTKLDEPSSLSWSLPEILPVKDPQIIPGSNDMDVSLRLRQSLEMVKMKGGLTDIQLFPCTFHKRHEQEQMLMPCDVHFAIVAPHGRNPQMEVSVSSVILDITPATIRTITAVAAGLAPPVVTRLQTVLTSYWIHNQGFELCGEDGDQKPLPSDLWTIRKLSDCHFWFLQQAKEVSLLDPFAPLSTEESGDRRSEELLLDMPSLVVKLEGGIGHRTIPLLIVEASFQAQLSVDSVLDLEVAYYNEKLAVWEPLIEPVIEDTKMRRWQLALEVSTLDENLGLDETGADDEPVLLPSKMVINVTSSDPLQVSITKGCLEVLTNLGKAFNDAYNLVELEGKKGEVLSPFLFKNNTGYKILLKLDPSFEVRSRTSQHSEEYLEYSQLESSVHNRVKLSDTPLEVFDSKKKRRMTTVSLIKATQEQDQRKIYFLVEQLGATREVTIKRAEKRLFQINQRSHQGEVWSVVCTTDCKIGQKTVSFQSIVRNNLSFPVEVLYRGDTKLESCGVASPDDLLSLPLDAVYSQSNELFFRPMGSSYEVSQKAMNWRSAENTGQQEMCCPSTQKGHSACYFNVCPEVENIYFEAGEEMTAKTYTLCLQPTTILHNLLPLDINYMLEGTSERESLAKGENSALIQASVQESTLEIVIPSYQGMEFVRLFLWLLEIPSYQGQEFVRLFLWLFEIPSYQGLEFVRLFLWLFEIPSYQGLEFIPSYQGLEFVRLFLWLFEIPSYQGLEFVRLFLWLFEIPSYQGMEFVRLFLWLFQIPSYQGLEFIPSYQGLEWVGRHKLQKNSPQLTVWEFTADRGAQKLTMELGLHSKVNKGTVDISLFCPYWILNKTGCKLAVRGSDQDIPVEHSPDMDQLILFSFESKSRSRSAGRKKAHLKIQDLDWSDKFSMDTVGSSGTVQCKSKSQTAEVGVSIVLSSSGLTKIVTFTPFYMFLNKAEIAILVTEPGDENWQEVSPGQAHTTLLKLKNEYGGINTQCQVTESSMITTLQTYRPGFATVQIVNHTDRHNIMFYQSDNPMMERKVGPQEALLYSWDNALGIRELVWSCGWQREVKTDLLQDDMEEFFADADSKVYWVSFLDGLQRFLLFTEDITVAASAQEAGELERVEQEINLQLQGLGLSLVDNYTQHEVAFLGITSSGVIWEERKKRRYKALRLKDCIILEAAWQKYQNDLVDLETFTATTCDIDFTAKQMTSLPTFMTYKIDFSNMALMRPRSYSIRRSFENGIWVQYKTSPHQLQLHAKINRIQLDNQLSHAVFPTVFSPLPPPRSIAAESTPKPFMEVSVMMRKHEHSNVQQINVPVFLTVAQCTGIHDAPKPFMEVSVMMRKHEHSNVQQIKYFKVLIQEMRVSVDQGFLLAIMELFAANEPLPRQQETVQFNEDVAQTEKTLFEVAGLSLAEDQKNFYDYLHFSPIKVHLSFSLQTGTGSSDGKPTEIQSGVVNVFLQSVGVVLTDVQDVVFKLGYFERSHAFYNQTQLTAEMTQHYAGQAIKQMYVLVLGLDVLGNPFGLLRGLSEGIEDLFYEPYLGAIQGPEEFAEGLALGVRSLFGHAVGGAAAAVSRITGTLGKGLATLTLDYEYQKKRREQLNKRPANAREGFARGGKGLVMGVVDGVAGILRKPVEGAKREGVGGFFKGVGKGLVGFVTRPTTGMMDFASSSFEGIRRIAEVQDETRRLRPPRRFFKDKVIRPYNHQEAEGCAILQEIEKGKYAKTDEYQAHVVVSKDGKNIFIVTDNSATKKDVIIIDPKLSQ